MKPLESSLDDSKILESSLELLELSLVTARRNGKKKLFLLNMPAPVLSDY